MPEWLGTGLQNRGLRFESGWYLKFYYGEKVVSLLTAFFLN